MLETETNIPMKNITINLPNSYDKKIQELIKDKITPSRSEAVRTAIRDFLGVLIPFCKDLGYEFNGIEKVQIKQEKRYGKCGK